KIKDTTGQSLAYVYGGRKKTKLSFPKCPRKPKKRASPPQNKKILSGGISLKRPTPPPRQTVHKKTDPIARPTGGLALFFSRVSGCQSTRGGIARVESSSTQEQRHC